jgi:hypothetical protein
MRDWSPAARPSSCYALPRRTKVKVMARASLWLKTRKVTSPSLPHSASPTLQKLHHRTSRHPNRRSTRAGTA